MDLRRAGARAFVAALLAALGGTASAADYVEVPAGTLASAIAANASSVPVPIDAFWMRVSPVTQGEFRRFVEGAPEWQRGRVAQVFADAGYLQDWRGETTL